MANLPSVRDYHSVAVLLPDARVMMAGWNNPTIEIFSPSYLFRGPRPCITAAPETVHRGAEFTIESPEASDMCKAVLVRPMAVTHQTDSEQRVIELNGPCHGASKTQLKLRAPGGTEPYPVAPRGHYMLFVLNGDGVPSPASWVFLDD